MRKTEERVIGEHRFEVTQLGFGQGRKLLVKLAQVVAPSLAGALKGKQSIQKAQEGKDNLLDMDVSDAIGLLADRIDDDLLEHATATLAQHTRVGSVGESDKAVKLSEVQEELFAGRYDLWMQWLRFALEVNYADFFAAISAADAGPLVGNKG